MRLRFVLESGFGYVREMAARLKSLLVGSWSSRFIFGFMVFLIVAAVFLSAGLPDIAEGLGVVAYFMLTVGVVLQLAEFVTRRGKTADGASD